MRAMLLEAVHQSLRTAEIAAPTITAGQVLVRISACGVCRTDLHITDGDLPNPARPRALGHEIVGTLVDVGPGVEQRAVGDRVGIPWLGWTCGLCEFCTSGRENLCEQARFTGYHQRYAEYVACDARYFFVLPDGFADLEAAPLLCAGLIGYRSLHAAGDARRVGLYGFGAAAHIVAQIAHFEGREVYAFTRPGDSDGQAFARSLGAQWAGDSTTPPPEPLDAAIIYAPVGALVPAALKAVRKGGTVVCAGIHMSDVPALPYKLLWGERVVIRSEPNATRRRRVPHARSPHPDTQRDLRVLARARERGAGRSARSRIRGAAVLRVAPVS